jgi:hypothetical protein
MMQYLRKDFAICGYGGVVGGTCPKMFCDAPAPTSSQVKAGSKVVAVTPSQSRKALALALPSQPVAGNAVAHI